MAETRTARLVSSRTISESTQVLRFVLEQDLGFTGGQYVIVNTGIELEGGKTVKRAYSILSSDTDQRSFEIAIRRIGSGPGSNHMASLEEGSPLNFTGPWGKYLPPADAVASSPVVVFATDTGITAALGLIRGMRFQECLPRTSVYWLVEDDTYFLSQSFVQEHLPAALGRLTVVSVPSASELRAAWINANVKMLIQSVVMINPSTVYLSGDGSLLAVFRDAFNSGMDIKPVISIESFFHHQSLKEPAKEPLTR